MVKRFFLLLLVCSFFSPVMARHITGGEMFYEYVGTSESGITYRVTLKLYRDFYSSGANLDQLVNFGIFTTAGSFVRTVSVPLNNVEQLQLRSPGPCITNPPVVYYEVGYYTTTVTLPATADGYTISFQRCCRVGGIENILNSASLGVTYIATIPGRGTGNQNNHINNSARFRGKDTVAICANTYFEYDFGADDPDRGDSVAYEFCEAYMGGYMNSPSPQVPDPPPYSSVPYAPPFHGGNPMGSGVTVDPHTGMVSGIAPSAGIYVLTVCAKEFRDGRYINTNRKDIQVAVAGCITTEAALEPEYNLCDSFTMRFQNRNRSPLINSQYWDFGVPGTNQDVSTEMSPTFTYGDTGVYTLTLITNPGQECSDTSYSTVRVFPGFKPGFSFFESCANVPIAFTDTTTATYGTVNYHRWNFGDATTNDDTSRISSPTYTYGSTGSRIVTLDVATSKGCKASVSSTVNILLKPPIQLTNDTLICDIDTLQLNAGGIGTMTWFPDYMISNTSSSNPLVSPDVPTKYYVNLVTVPGCENTDSVFVDVRSFVTIDAGNDTTICQTDSLMLRPSGDALGFTWTPAFNMNNNRLKDPTAAPLTNTRFEVTGTIGKCSATDFVNVRVIPYPQADAGEDHLICMDSAALLQGFINGASFNWSPVHTLSNANTLTPLASPKITTRYVLTAFDTIGCPKPFSDTALVQVMPEVQASAGNDTLVVINQPLQLSGNGGETYQWSPATGLNDPTSSNPVATLTNDIQYAVKVTTTQGCYNFDTINVKVFKSAPDIFVPNAFTPNNDGHNDLLKITVVGIRNFEYFNVYNRWGQLVFTTSDPTRGWNGTVNGLPQSAQSYVWMAAGTDYLGTPLLRKGTLVLIR